MLADIKGPHLDFWGGPNSLSPGSGSSNIRSFAMERSEAGQSTLLASTNWY